MDVNLRAGSILYSGCSLTKSSDLDIHFIEIVDSPLAASRFILDKRYYVVSKDFQDKVGGFQFTATNSVTQCSNKEIKRLLEDNGYEFIPSVHGGKIAHIPRRDGDFVTVTGTIVVNLLTEKYGYQYTQNSTLKVYLDDDGATVSYPSINHGYLVLAKLTKDIFLRRTDDEWDNRVDFVSKKAAISHLNYIDKLDGYYCRSRLNCGSSGFLYYNKIALNQRVLDSLVIELVPIDAPAIISPDGEDDFRKMLDAINISNELGTHNVTPFSR